MADEPAARIRKLVAMAASDPTPETAVAARKAREAIAQLDVTLLDTLAGQRKRLLKELRAESERLFSSHERATKTETGELVSDALLLFRHYERYDALIAAVLLLRVEDGHRLTNEERQQLDGPVEDWLDRWSTETRERRREKREERRRKARERARATP